MKQEGAQSVLRRLMRTAQEVAKEPVTSARALRLAMARSAERSVGLTLTVIGVTEEVMSLDLLLAQVDPGSMLISIGTEDRLIGFAGLDLQTRTAVVEVQTLGELRTLPAPERPVTASDAALCAPFVARFLSDFAVTSDATPLAGWTDDLAAGARFADARAVGMVLPDTDMRLVKLSLDLGTGERQGLLALALPVRRVLQRVERIGPGLRFSEQFQANVMQAPAALNAVLHRFRLPLRTVAEFGIGQILPLPGITVRSVRIEAPDGTAVGEGRLGQITGLRAVRIEARGAAEIAEMRMAARRVAAEPPAPERPTAQAPRATPGGADFAAEMDATGTTGHRDAAGSSPASPTDTSLTDTSPADASLESPSAPGPDTPEGGAFDDGPTPISEHTDYDPPDPPPLDD